MDNLILRIPYIAQLVFEEVDDKTLVNYKTASESWLSFIGEKKIEWLRIILKYAGNMTEFADHWKQLLHRTPIKIVKEIALIVGEFFSANPKRKDYQWSPFVIGFFSNCSSQKPFTKLSFYQLFFMILTSLT